MTIDTLLQSAADARVSACIAMREARCRLTEVRLWHCFGDPRRVAVNLERAAEERRHAQRMLLQSRATSARAMRLQSMLGA